MSQDRDERQYSRENDESDPGYDRGYMQKNVLKGMEAYEPVFVVGLNNQKQDCRNYRHVSQHASYVVSHSSSRRCNWMCHGSRCTATCRTKGGTIRCLSATHCAERHN